MLTSRGTWQRALRSSNRDRERWGPYARNLVNNVSALQKLYEENEPGGVMHVLRLWLGGAGGAGVLRPYP